MTQSLPAINPDTDALVIIDVQNDFIPGGSLAVSGGDEIIAGIAELADQFKTIVLSQDWHPAGHKSFASSHGAEPYSQTKMPYGKQTLWPDHCVQGSEGAQFHRDLIASGVVDRASLIIRKGMNPDVDSYSAFYENDKITSTGLMGYLKDKNIDRVFFVGLAYDFCVGFSALDAATGDLKGSDGRWFEVVVVKDLTRAIDAPLSKDELIRSEPTILTTSAKMDFMLESEGIEVVNFKRPSATPKLKA